MQCHACHTVTVSRWYGFSVVLGCHGGHAAVTRISFRSLGLVLSVPLMIMDESGKKNRDFLRSALSVIGGG